jgi:hypothetical protein
VVSDSTLLLQAVQELRRSRADTYSSAAKPAQTSTAAVSCSSGPPSLDIRHVLELHQWYFSGLQLHKGLQDRPAALLVLSTHGRCVLWYQARAQGPLGNWVPLLSGAPPSVSN